MIRLSSGMSEVMESRRADPDVVEDGAPRGDEGGLAAPDQAGDDCRVGLDQHRCAENWREVLILVGPGGDEVASLEDGLERVADEWIGSPEGLDIVGATRRRGQQRGDVDEQPPARLRHGPRRRQLPEGETQRLHGVGHHLLMTDGDVDVIPLVLLRGNREQRGDRATLDDVRAVVIEAPLNVLGLAEVGLDPSAEPLQIDHLHVGQYRLLLPLRPDRHLLGPTPRRRDDGDPFGGDRLGHDVAVAYGVDVRARQTGDERLTEAEAGLHGAELPVGRDRVGREQDAGRLWEDHLLHDHRHAGLAIVEAVVQPVGHGALGEQGRPAPTDVREDGSRPHDVQVRVLLPSEGSCRRIFRRRTGPDGAGAVFAEPGERTGDGGRQIAGYLDRFEGLTDAGTDRPDCLPVGRVEERQSIETFVDVRCLRQDLPEGVRGHAEAGRHAHAVDPPQLAEACALSADHRDLRLVDLPQMQHVTAHPSTFPVGFHQRPDFVTAVGRADSPVELRPALSADQWSLRQAPHLHVS